jgi:hypothetical protein
MGDYGFFELAAWVRSVLYQEMGTAAQVAAAANLGMVFKTPVAVATESIYST